MNQKLLSPARAPHRLLQPQHVTDYERNGVVHIKGAVSPSEVNLLRRGIAKQMERQGESMSSYDFEDMQRQAFASSAVDLDFGSAERFDIDLLKFIVQADPDARPLRDPLPPLDGAHDEVKPGFFFHDAAGWKFHDEIRKVACESALPAIANGLMRSERTHFWEDTTFVKGPRTPQRTVCHQDWSYFQISGEQCCIVWIALDDVDAENGRMEYVRGSHLWGQPFAPNIFFAQSASPISPYEKLPDIEGKRDDYDIVAFDCAPGDVIVHHVMTVHGSGGNLSADRTRRAVSFRYCGDDIRYFDKPGAIEQQYLTTHLENGDPLHGPDYPLVFPSRI